MPVKTYLTLGRVSNLPTVWTNVLAAGALAGATLLSPGWFALLAAMSLFYIAGMYYNDACDAGHDAIMQPHRPIPSGLISRDRVAGFALAFAVVGFMLVFASRQLASTTQVSNNTGWLIGTIALLTCIVTYNKHHKNNPFSPLIMAGCRISVLITASYTLTAALPDMLLLAIASMLCWLIGLTYFAKYEQSTSAQLEKYWPLALLALPVFAGLGLSLSSATVLLPLSALMMALIIAYNWLTTGPPAAKGRAIALLIASICLLDGLFLSYAWGIGGAAASLLAFALTLSLQKTIAGT